MPFYEYECQSCKFYTEVMQKITDAPLTKCPSCGKKKLVKLVSAPVFRLKGSGWYETDFKGDKENKRNLAGGDRDEPKAESTADAKSDAKPDAKSDSTTESKTPAVEAKSASAEPVESKRRSASARSAGRVAPSKGKSKPAAKAPSRAPSRGKVKPKGKAKAKGRR
jgi:putative FmdB family regulatory protein